MKKLEFLLLLAGIGLSWQTCTNAQCPPAGATSLAVAEFSEKVKACPDALLLDVRTPDEFAAGHLSGAVNINWNGSGFAEKEARLDKSKSVFIYCLSGGRSGEAAKKLRADGFQSVIEMQGGIMKWRAANLPLDMGSAPPPPSGNGMAQADFDKLLKSEKLVLVDFYAPWCAPCKRMAPYLDEIKKDMADRVEVVRIDVDQSQELARSLSVEALPTLLIYRKGQSVWRNVGFIEKAEVVAKLGSL